MGPRRHLFDRTPNKSFQSALRRKRALYGGEDCNAWNSDQSKSPMGDLRQANAAQTLNVSKRRALPRNSRPGARATLTWANDGANGCRRAASSLRRQFLAERYGVAWKFEVRRVRPTTGLTRHRLQRRRRAALPTRIGEILVALKGGCDSDA